MMLESITKVEIFSHFIIDEGKKEICCVLEAQKGREGNVDDDPEGGKDADLLIVNHWRTAEDIDKLPVPIFLDALFTRSADVDATFVALVKLSLMFVEIFEALVTADFDFCLGWRHCVNKPINVFDFTAGVYKWTFIFLGRFFFYE